MRQLVLKLEVLLLLDLEHALLEIAVGLEVVVLPLRDAPQIGVRDPVRRQNVLRRPDRLHVNVVAQLNLNMLPSPDGP